MPDDDGQAGSAQGPPRATMRDIAALAGVSRTTVSHALSGQGRVRESTRQRVLDIAAELGFVPSATALALKTGRHGVVAVVNATSEGSLEYFMLAATAASREALKAGYVPAMVPTEAQESWVTQLAMDGAIVLDPLDDDQIMRALHARGIPVVAVGGEPNSSTGAGPTIRTDRIAGVNTVLDHLLERGARQPALIIGHQRRQWIAETTSAYSRWMRDHDLQPVIRVASDGEDPGRAGYDAARHLLEDPAVDAIYVPFDPMMDGVLTALAELGVDVPGNVRIVAQEGIRARTTHPSLSALDDRPDEVARSAMHALLAQLEHGVQTPTTLVRPHLIVRSTT